MDYLASFTLDDLFNMAIEMEKSGAEYYREAAAAATDPSIKAELLRLVAMETDHKAQFTRMRAQLAPRTSKPASEFDATMAAYARTWITGEVFESPEADPITIAKSGSLSKMLLKAVELEKSAIAFYTGMREMAGDQQAQGALSQIIRDEIGHVVFLSKKYSDAVAAHR